MFLKFLLNSWSSWSRGSLCSLCEIVWKDLRDFRYLLFERVWKNLGGPLWVVFEVLWKNLWDSFWVVFEIINFLLINAAFFTQLGFFAFTKSFSLWSSRFSSATKFPKSNFCSVVFEGVDHYVAILIPPDLVLLEGGFRSPSSPACVLR